MCWRGAQGNITGTEDFKIILGFWNKFMVGDGYMNKNREIANAI